MCAFVESEFIADQLTAIPFSSLEEISGFLSDIQATTAFIALDAPSSNQFTPIPVADVLRELRSRCN